MSTFILPPSTFVEVVFPRNTGDDGGDPAAAAVAADRDETDVMLVLTEQSAKAFGRCSISLCETKKNCRH